MHLKLKMSNAVITGYDAFGERITMNIQVPIKSLDNSLRNLFNRIFGKRFSKIKLIKVQNG